MSDQQHVHTWNSDEIRDIVRCQKNLIRSFGYLPLVAMLALPDTAGGFWRLAGIILLPPLFAYEVYRTCRLARATRTRITPLTWLVILLPIVNMYAMFTLNSQATQILRQYGLQVGLHGADPESVDRAQNPGANPSSPP